MNAQLPIATHQWASGGVSSYPLTHPIVGQGNFYRTFQQFIHVVDREAEQFAHVFAIIAQWGVGKSRLAYELISQINATSPGWYVRNPAGSLVKAELFYNDSDREQYLGLYIRYSQVANEYHNLDNWFGYGLYKALLPLAKGVFDGSIQATIAKEAYDRLTVLDFDAAKLAEALELSNNYTDETLSEDPYLVTSLCQAAYNYLSQFGIKYILLALDELETVAETATYGLEDSDIKYLDGRAIKLLGKAIKEEDPRRKLPWLRYVALCSPAIGEELREIQSTARRFELVELSQNAFADVSDFVKAMPAAGRLSETYPEGLVEAAYAMSGGNFGWFNVIMANVDQILRSRRIRGENDLPSVGAIFDEAVRVSTRIREYVLDHNAISELKLADRTHLLAARELLYGQLPVPLSQWQPEELNALLNGCNEYDEPITLLYRRVEWDDLECNRALRDAKFSRDKEVWELGGVDQPLDLKQLLANLSTYAIHEPRSSKDQGKHILLVPLRLNDFVQLVSLLYPHPAVEDAARALWRYFIGSNDLNESDATHIGPSIAMLGRLNLRYRKQSQNSLIFRDPDRSATHEKAIAQRRNQPGSAKASQILTGAMRILDKNWSYNPVSAGMKDNLVAIATESGSRGRTGGLVTCDALKLHPKGRLILAWVSNTQELELLCNQASAQFNNQGRTPVIAFTSSRSLVDLFANPSSGVLKNARSYLLLYQLSDAEEFVLHQVGLPTSDYVGFKLESQGFTTAFTNRINSLVRPLMEEIHKWRRQLNDQGAIAWPLLPSGTLKDNEKQLLFQAWRFLMVDRDPPQSLAQLDETSGLDVQAVVAILQKLSITNKARAAGYGEDERALLFDSLDDTANPVFPPILIGVLERLLSGKSWTLEAAEREWFWGYTWDGAKPKETFLEWMSLACELEFAEVDPNVTGSKDKSYSLRSRSELSNLIQEATNWLQNDYPQIVSNMEAVFGEGKVREFFAPLNSTRVGTKTSTAQAAIERAQSHLSALNTEEGIDYNSTKAENKQGIFLQSARRRRELLQDIRSVYLHEEYERVPEDENIKTLNFEIDSEPLWRRIRRAEIFSKRVQEVEQRISERIDEFSNEMRSQVEGLTGFPVFLFTLSLEKIRNILEGALHTGTPRNSTGRRQLTQAGTLGQYLKDLKVADATEKLAQLAREVGVDIDGRSELSLEEINGDIVITFRGFKRAYQKLTERLANVRNKLQTLEKVLHDTPSDFVYLKLSPLSKLLALPSLIEGTLENIKDEEAERLRSDSMYDKPAKLGNFQPLMQAVFDLLTEPKRSLDTLEGQVLSLENAVKAYRKNLLNDTSVQSIEHGLNALLQITGTTPRKSLDLPELEAAGSLKAAIALVEERRREGVTVAEKILAQTGVSFDRWQRVVADIEQGRDPQLEPQEADNLVARGLLIRTYRLGGQR